MVECQSKAWWRVPVVWLAQVLAEQVVLALVYTLPVSYVLGWTTEFVRSGGVDMDRLAGVLQLPPFFLANIGLLRAWPFLLPRAFVAPLKRWWNKPSPLDEAKENAYRLVRSAYNPIAGVDVDFGNEDMDWRFQCRKAQDAVDMLIPLLEKCQLEHPSYIDAEKHRISPYLA